MTNCTEGAKDGLEVCESVELACAELYHYFAEQFKGDRESFLLWLKAAMVEENHARLFSLLGKLRGNDVESIPVVSLDAEAMLLYVQSLLETVRQRPLGMKEALLVAIDLEGRMDFFLKEKVMKMADQSYEKSFLTMTAAGSVHLESLQGALARLTA